MSVHIDTTQGLLVSEKLKVLRLPSAKRQRLLAKQGRIIRAAAADNVKQQRDVQGRKFAPRKPQKGSEFATRDSKIKRRPARLLKNFAKARNLKVKATPSQARIGYDSRTTARIARLQQDGFTATMTAARMAKKHGKPDYDAPATKRQARALRDEGFKIRRAGGRGGKTVGLKWIMENMTVGQAGVILRSMRDKTPSKMWKIETPGREFLGVNKENRQALTAVLKNEVLSK